MNNPPELDTSKGHDFESWPRDFDFREQYAEQQELLRTPFAAQPAADSMKGPHHA